MPFYLKKKNNYCIVASDILIKPPEEIIRKQDLRLARKFRTANKSIMFEAVKHL